MMSVENQFGDEQKFTHSLDTHIIHFCGDAPAGAHQGRKRCLIFPFGTHGMRVLASEGYNL